MWLASVAAVVLVYLAVAFGSHLFLRRVEIVPTVLLVFVFLAQSGMFAVLSVAPDRLASRWFFFFGAFSIIAGLEVLFVRRIVVRHGTARYTASIVNIYMFGLLVDVIMATVSAIFALVMVIFWNDAPPVAVFIAACIALGLMIGANAQQYLERKKLANEGVF
jgi:hypothetical protein